MFLFFCYLVSGESNVLTLSETETSLEIQYEVLMEILHYSRTQQNATERTPLSNFGEKY